ncbi:hypothetical protein AYO40_06500 [Planctomycetaceae bacterium SCGC AG-212-D15]|nr:hypothetical protein AYO40_06500 [Planctomycetaceae bacterium SCGC AG-212-D15]
MFWHRKKRGDGPDVEVPVTPMLDMAFQLLTFFIFTYHPSAMEGQVEMALPPSTEERWNGPVVERPLADDPVDNLQDAPIVVRVRTQHGEEAGSIVYPIEVGAETANSLMELERKLESAGKGLEQRVVRIESDRQLKWALVFEVIDACKHAEFRVAFAAPPDR